MPRLQDLPAEKRHWGRQTGPVGAQILGQTNSQKTVSHRGRNLQGGVIDARRGGGLNAG